MITIFIVDSSAGSRSKIVERIHTILAEGARELHFLPQIECKPLGVEEVRYHPAPDALVIGPELIGSRSGEVASLRKHFLSSTLYVIPPQSWDGLSHIEHFARLGVNDVLSSSLTSREVLQKFILLAQRIPEKKKGTLIAVVGGKGGAGVTSIVAGIGERILDLGKRVALVDLDGETQDLTRFLHVRPWYNEALHRCVEGTGALTEDTAKECSYPVWIDTPNLVCVPPLLATRTLSLQSDVLVRTYLSFFEHLDRSYEVTIVDCANVAPSFLSMIAQACDCMVYVVPNDPAALYASTQRISSLAELLHMKSRLLCVENRVSPYGALGALVREEFARAVQNIQYEWFPSCIPLSKKGGRWPGSGSSIIAQGDRRLEGVFQSLVASLGFGAAELKERHTVRAVREFITSWRSVRALPAPPQNPALPDAVQQESTETLLLIDSPREEKLVSQVNVV